MLSFRRNISSKIFSFATRSFRFSKFSSTAKINRLSLKLSNLKCSGCISSIENSLMKKSGVKNVSVNIVTNKCSIDYDSGEIKDSELLSLLSYQGFPAKIWSSNIKSMDSENKYVNIPESLLMLSLFGIAMFGHSHHFLSIMGSESVSNAVLSSLNFTSSPLVQGCAATIALLGPGRSIVSDGVVSLWNGHPNMNSLIMIGTTAAYSSSMASTLLPSLSLATSFEECTMLLGFIYAGKFLENRAKHETGSSIHSLANLQPTKVRLVKETRSKRNVFFCLISDIDVGDIVQVLPGENIPVDGTVIDGISSIDQSMVTGESEAVIVSPSSKVIGGSTNIDGSILIRVGSTEEDCMLHKMVNFIEESTATKPPIAKIADKIAGGFTYGILGLCAGTIVFWAGVVPALFPNLLTDILSTTAADGSDGLILGMKLAVDASLAACPCALGLAVPTAIICGTGEAAKYGLLFKGSDTFEELPKIDTIVFDKTGTLTYGKPKVTNIYALNGKPSSISSTSNISNSNEFNSEKAAFERLVISHCLAVQQGANHPVSNAVTAAAEELLLGRSHDSNSSISRSSMSIDDGGLRVETPSILYGGVCPAVKNHRTFPGLGVMADIEYSSSNGESTLRNLETNPTNNTKKPKLSSQYRILMGNMKFISKYSRLSVNSLSATHRDRLYSILQSCYTDGASPSIVVRDGVITAILAIKDTLRKEAPFVVNQLRFQGYKVMILSGDKIEVVQSVANEILVDAGATTGDSGDLSVRGDLDPLEKCEIIKQLQTEGRTICMVGDGINDAPSLVQADVGIALRSGSDIAYKSADIVTMTSNLRSISHAFTIGKLTMRKIHLNLLWAFAYNILILPVAMGVFLPVYKVSLSPSLAAGAMVSSHICVLTNSLLLKRSIKKALRR